MLQKYEKNTPEALEFVNVVMSDLKSNLKKIGVDQDDLAGDIDPNSALGRFFANRWKPLWTQYGFPLPEN
jgi:hypothetical protein